ncbi:MAG: TorF family putative porin [Polynucleobacter victoriensis]
MKTYLTLSAIALAAAATLSSGAVMAADPAPAEIPAITITPNIGIVSDYLFRGISQNNKQAALQGGIDVAFKEGFYVGTWASQVSNWTAGPKGDGYELDLYGGYKTELSGVGVDVGVITYNYPGSKSGASDGTNYLANTQEAYIGLTYGPATFKTSYVLGKHYFASTANANASAKGTLYYDLTLAQEIAPKLTVSAHAGYTDYKEPAAYYASTGKFSYSDYNVGLTYDYEGFLLGAKYYFNSTKAGTKAYADGSGVGEKSNLYKNTLVFSVLKAF